MTESDTQIFCGEGGGRFFLIIICNCQIFRDMLLIEEELAIELWVRGYHVYNGVWVAAVRKSYHVNMRPGTQRT